MCHNDWGPHNCVFADRVPFGIIDFDTLKPGEDMVGLEKAFEAAEEDYRPGEGKKK